MAGERGLRLLCLDAGGVRGTVPLRILQNLKARTNKEPHELFDLICGTSSGGILAILLGVLKVPVDECVALFENLSKDVLEVGFWQTATNIVDDHAIYRSEVLEEFIKNAVLESSGHSDLQLREVPPPPRVFVVARR